MRIDCPPRPHIWLLMVQKTSDRTPCLRILSKSVLLSKVQMQSSEQSHHPQMIEAIIANVCCPLNNTTKTLSSSTMFNAGPAYSEISSHHLRRKNGFEECTQVFANLFAIKVQAH